MTEQATMEPVQRLLAIEAIQFLKARYFRLVDTKRWDACRELFDADVRFHFSRGEIRGVDAVMAAISGGLVGVTSVHHDHMPEIDVTSDTTASGIWAMSDYAEHRAADGERTGLVGYGHYHEDYVKRDGSWKIASLRHERLRLDKSTTTSENLG